MIELTELEANEIRVLGSLMEKEQTTPDYYPMTLKGLLAACNQKSNREPVIQLTESRVLTALQSLTEKGLVEHVRGARVGRWGHRADEHLRFRPDYKAALTILFLRGPQTLGEIRVRTERMHSFSSLSEIEEVLMELATQETPLVQSLGRRAGQKEERWGLAGQDYPEPMESPASGASSQLEERVTRLEEDFRRLREKVDRISSFREPGEVD